MSFQGIVSQSPTFVAGAVGAAGLAISSNFEGSYKIAGFVLTALAALVAHSHQTSVLEKPLREKAELEHLESHLNYLNIELTLYDSFKKYLIETPGAQVLNGVDVLCLGKGSILDKERQAVLVRMNQLKSNG